MQIIVGRGGFQDFLLKENISPVSSGVSWKGREGHKEHLILEEISIYLQFFLLTVKVYH